MSSDNLLGFAEFGFPKSHATAFALLAYQSAWLKRYYPAEFSCALFNNQPMGFYPPHVLTNDAQRHGIAVLRPDINISRAACAVEQEDGGGAVRIGLGYVRQLGAATSLAIERERDRGGPFRSLFEFVQRTGLPRQATENLIRVGAVDGFGLNRRELNLATGAVWGGAGARAAPPPPSAAAAVTPAHGAGCRCASRIFTAYQRMAADYELLGLSPDHHPLEFLRPALGEGVLSSRHLPALPAGPPRSPSPVWWSGGSVPSPREGSSSCCSKTNTAWST